MKILNYKLSSTNELLTARIGLLATAHTINTLSLLIPLINTSQPLVAIVHSKPPLLSIP
ncbi:hypothetical protein [uncultured Gammaproteobacteria bacterium]|nr:hypothetical protein [uncultured Gammaproteobacteria bacterium]